MYALWSPIFILVEETRALGGCWREVHDATRRRTGGYLKGIEGALGVSEVLGTLSRLSISCF